jgi:hypothetical protein
MNNISLSATPMAPSLLERLSNNPEGLGPPEKAVAVPGGSVLGWNVVELEEGDVVQLVLNNKDTSKNKQLWTFPTDIPQMSHFTRFRVFLL